MLLIVIMCLEESFVDIQRRQQSDHRIKSQFRIVDDHERQEAPKAADDQE